MLENQMEKSDDCIEAYRQWQEHPLIDRGATNRLSSDEAHARR
jgi:hypothetical protein